MKKLSAGGMSVTCPPKWREAVRVTFTEEVEERFAQNIVIERRPLGKEMGLDRWSAQQLATLQSEIQNLDIARKMKVTIDGEDARIVELVWGPPHLRIKQMQGYVVMDGDGITITCTSTENDFEKYRGIFQKVVERVKFDRPDPKEAS